MQTNQQLQAIQARAQACTPAPEESSPCKEVWMIGHLMDIVQAYRTDVPALLADVAELHVKVKLFTDSFTQAARLWREKHPDQPVFPDGPENMVWAIEELEQYYKVAQKEQEPGGILDQWISKCGDLQRENAELQATVTATGNNLWAEIDRLNTKAEELHILALEAEKQLDEKRIADDYINRLVAEHREEMSALRAKLAELEKTTLACAGATAQLGLENDTLRARCADYEHQLRAQLTRLVESAKQRDAALKALGLMKGVTGADQFVVLPADKDGRIWLGPDTFVRAETLQEAMAQFQAKKAIGLRPNSR